MITTAQYQTAATSGLHVGVVGPVSIEKFARDLETQSNPLPYGFPGTTTPVDIVIRSLLDLGYKVTAVTLDPKVDAGTTERLLGERLEIFVGHYRPRHRARDLFATERRIIRDSLLASKPNVISAHWSYEFALGAIDSGLPTLVTVHDVPSEVFRHQPSMYRMVRWLMHNQVMRRAHLVGFNSPYTQSKLGVRDHSLPILPYGLADDEWRCSDRPPPSPEYPRFVSVNNGFSRRKNVKCLLWAHAIVRRERPGARLTLIGEAYEPTGVAMQWAEEHDLVENVDFVGPRPYEATMDSIRASDVLIHPSLEESFGLTLIEAARVGTPVVAGARSGAVPWVLGHGEAGILTDVRSATAIATSLTQIVDDREAWLALRGRAFRSARSRFTASVMAKRYLCALERIAGRE